jgi:hypothetical protein
VSSACTSGKDPALLAIKGKDLRMRFQTGPIFEPATGLGGVAKFFTFFLNYDMSNSEKSAAKEGFSL